VLSMRTSLLAIGSEIGASAAAGSHYELADAPLGVCPPLRGEALVVVLVAGEDHVGVRLVERFPQLLHLPAVEPCFSPELKRGWCIYARVHCASSLAARSSLSHLVWGEPGPQRTSSQLLLRATTCQDPSS